MMNDVSNKMFLLVVNSCRRDWQVDWVLFKWLLVQLGSCNTRLHLSDNLYFRHSFAHLVGGIAVRDVEIHARHDEVGLLSLKIDLVITVILD